MPYIYLDESGQFNQHNHEKYFVVASFTIGNHRRTDKQFRSWYKSRFPRKMKFLSEIKFSEVKIADDLRLKTLRFISNLDVRIHYSYMLRKNIPEEYYKKNKLESGLLYTNIIGETLEMYLPTSDKEFRVFCDQRHLKGFKTKDFKKNLTARLLPQLPANSIIQIEMIDSTSNANIQIVDWIAGGIARYLEKKPLGEDCYQLLKNNIIKDGKELFCNYWDEKYNKQKTQP